MSYLEDGNRDMDDREHVKARDSFRSDSSILEDLLTKLHDFPHVPNEISLNAEMLPLIIDLPEDHMSSKHIPVTVSPITDNNPEMVLEVLPLEAESDATDACLQASRILRSHPGLVMEHYDPTTSVHTFKIAYPRRQHDEYHQLSSPVTPSLSNSSSPSPLTPSMQTPLPGPLSRSGSVPLLSREPSESHSAPGSLHRAAYSTSSLASESLNSVLQYHPPLRRAASELSERASPTSQHTSRQSSRVALSPTPPLPSHPSPASERLARRFVHHVAGTSHDLGDVSSHLSDTLLSRGHSFMSSDELLAFREFLARRKEAVLTEKRNLAASPDSDQLPGFGENRNSFSSDRQFGLHVPEKTTSGASQPVYDSLHPEATSVFSTLEPLDGRTTKSDLLRALSFIRAERERVSCDEDALLDLYTRSSSPASQIRSDISPYGPRPASRPEFHTDSRPQSTDPSNRPGTASICIEEVQDFLPDFLDLRGDVDRPGSSSNELSSSDSDIPLFLSRHKRLASVPEGSAADLSRQRSPMQVRDDRGDLLTVKLPPVNHLRSRRTQSDAELVSGRSQNVRPLPSSESYLQPWVRHDGLPHGDPEGRRAYHQTKPVLTTVGAEMIEGEEVRRRYDSGNSSLAEFTELAYSQCVPEPDSRRPEDSHYTKRVEAKRTRDSRPRKPSLRIALDSSSSREFLSPHEGGPVFHRQRAMTLQDLTASGPPTQDLLHRSASVTSTLSRSSSHRIRTLRDRAYRHPDVPRSPLFFDLDHPSSPKSASRVVPPTREPFSRYDKDEPRISSPEMGNTPALPSRDDSLGEVVSSNASPRPSELRPHPAPGHGRKESSLIRERPAQATLHRSGSSPELRPGAPGQPSTQGVGLSLVDNGAFEAPRRAPEPRSPANDRASVLSRLVQRGSNAALKKSADDDQGSDSYLAVDTASTVFGALSLRHVWSRKQKQESRSGSPAGQSHSAGSSLSGWQSSFMSVVDDDVKPQKKGLFKKKL